MDKTETFIKMADCPEIQELSPLNHKNTRWIEIGSWYAEGVSEGDIVCFGSIGADYKWYKEHRGKKLIWLPHQDQLQDMIDDDFIHKLGDIFKAVRDFKLTYYHHAEKEFPFTSMEQLWLAFVMKEKYNKIWNGEEWVNP